jgi:ABC-type multidrug transport system fused ATPase/permease subunit
MRDLGLRFWRNLTRRERTKVVLLIISVIVMAGLDVLSVGAIMPFLTIAGDPGVVHENALLSRLHASLGFTDERGFLIALGLLVFALVLFSSAWIAVTTYVQTRFVWGWNHTRATMLLGRYMRQPYSYFLSRNTADLSNNVLSEVQQVASQLLMPVIQGTGRAVAAIAIALALLLTEPMVALFATGILGGSYALIFLLLQGRLRRSGAARLEANRERFTVAAEGLGGIKDVKILGREDSFVKRFSRSSSTFSRNRAIGSVIAQLPRYGVEAVALGSVILLVVYIIVQGGDLESAIPLLGFYAFAGYRLMPALQQTFKGFTQLRFFAPSLETLLDEIEATPVEEGTSASGAMTLVPERGATRRSGPTEPLERQDTRPLRMRRELRLCRVSFRYPGATHPAISDLDLTIAANTTVGLVGSTGSGKTTLADLALGLIRPSRGALEVDGEPVTDARLRQWQARLGYVPQNIFLMDLSVAENIAFGLAPRHIDMEAVREAARTARIDEFVMDELPNGYDTIVGERGVKLSGGQRQRIGIARALYHRPSVLVFDEATSSLDNRTEDEVMAAIRALRGHKTVIMIAHRLTTLKDCDVIYMLEHGNIASSGTYRELVAGRGRFAELARAGD